MRSKVKRKSPVGRRRRKSPVGRRRRKSPVGRRKRGGAKVPDRGPGHHTPRYLDAGRRRKSPAGRRRRKSPAGRRRRKSPAGRRRRKSPAGRRRKSSAGRSRGGNIFSTVRGMFRKNSDENSDEAADRRYDDLFNMYEKLRRRLRYSIKQIDKISPSYWSRSDRERFKDFLEQDFPDREDFMDSPITRDIVNQDIKKLFKLVSATERFEELVKKKALLEQMDFNEGTNFMQSDPRVLAYDDSDDDWADDDDDW
jgi:hypothetical protein